MLYLCLNTAIYNFSFHWGCCITFVRNYSWTCFVFDCYYMYFFIKNFYTNKCHCRSILFFYWTEFIQSFSSLLWEFNDVHLLFPNHTFLRGTPDPTFTSFVIRVSILKVFLNKKKIVWTMSYIKTTENMYNLNKKQQFIYNLKN